MELRIFCYKSDILKTFLMCVVDLGLCCIDSPQTGWLQRASAYSLVGNGGSRAPSENIFLTNFFVLPEMSS